MLVVDILLQALHSRASAAELARALDQLLGLQHRGTVASALAQRRLVTLSQRLSADGELGGDALRLALGMIVALHQLDCAPAQLQAAAPRFGAEP